MWVYEPDEVPKRKHHWKHDYAGVVEHNGIRISKCPANMTLEEAAEMLNGGIAWPLSGEVEGGYPRRIYAVRDGVVYRATPTNPGVSYHGFPELIENLPPSRDLRARLLAAARDARCEAEVAQWLRQ